MQVILFFFLLFKLCKEKYDQTVKKVNVPSQLVFFMAKTVSFYLFFFLCFTTMKS